MNSYERKRRICKMIVLVLGILSINNIILTIRNYSYAYFEKNVKTGVKLKITTLDEMPKKTLYEKIKSKLNDSNSITDTDGTIYLSGSKSAINFNYVWYSGKLWRIVVINPDGSIKLVTQDAITSIYWGANATYEGSWIYQWLNEDFKDTLYDYKNIIVQNVDWNATEDGSDNPVIPPTDSTATKVTGDVGLLNAYEYSQAYKNASTSTNYLNIGYYWRLITPYSDSRVRSVNNHGNLFNDTPGSNAYGVRPSINLKSNIEIVEGGDGSETNPYRINEDKEPGNRGELINTRLSGEYVKVDNKVYRIVGIENGTTKLTSVNYVKDGDTVLIKNFGSNTSWADSVTSKSNDYWGHYLNNTWLTSELRNYITDGTYYLGIVGTSSTGSYKNSICSASNTTEPTSSCTRTTSTWTGLVGLPRVGEMFSAQLGSGYSLSSSIWLITPYRDYRGSSGRSVDQSGNLNINDPSGMIGTRPSINLKSEIKIISGDGMSPESAYTIGLPNA